MKNTQRRSFKLNPIAAAIAIAMTSQFAANVAQAGAGTGASVTSANLPQAIPTYYANSPTGPEPTYVNGVLQKRIDGSALPVTAQSGLLLRKFVDTLPGFGAANANNLGQYIPLAVAEKWVDPNGIITTDDYYEIAAVEFRERMHSDLPITGTHLRGYVQLETAANAATSKHIALTYPLPAGAAAGTLPVAITDPAKVTLANPTGQVYAYDNPHHLGPVITASKGTAVRVKFSNYLPLGGKLFLPVDTTILGAGLAPDGVTAYGQNRAGMHLVGGQAPWISAGSPHQWIAPALPLSGAAIDATGTIVTVAGANKLAVGAPVSGGGFPAGTTIASVTASGFTTSAASTTPGAAGVKLATTDALIGKGAGTQNATDMLDPGAGSVNLVFPNDMSARFTFIQDRTTGLTRLNAYAGLESAYVVTDPIEQTLINGGMLTGGGLKAAVTVAAGTIPAAQIPLIIEDKTFVPQNIAQQDALWDAVNWGAPGDLWFPHVYEKNQDTALSGGVNPVGRWDYGPLFWPIFPIHPLKATVPSPSAVPEAYMDTPLVNGTAYPTLTVEPKAYRLRILNASNDRYINLGLYTADPTATVAPLLDQNANPVVNAALVQQFLTNTEVKMVPAAPINALGSPPGWDTVGNVQLPLPQFGTTFPWNIHAEPSGPTRAWPVDGRAGGVPDPTTSGPDFVVIGNDGGLLPQAADIPPQPVTYEQNRRSITVLNIYGYGLLLGPSERADTIVDFSGYAGKTLILYNDAPAPAPFNDPRNDYYTGDPDQSAQGGAYPTLPGYGPNTRTLMQIKVGTAVTTGGPLIAANLAAALPAAYAASQPSPIVPEVVYNAAFGTTDTDNYGHVATGSAAQPSLIVSSSGGVTLTGFSLITSGGAGTGSGSGYVAPPAVVLTGGGGTGASACATINATGQVASVTFFDALLCPTGSVGSGYITTPTVTFVSSNTLSGIVVSDGGSGYVAPVTVTLTGGGLAGPTVVPASVTLSTATGVNTAVAPAAGAATVTAAGSGYLVPPTVSFAPPPNGITATGTAIISTSPLLAGSGVVANMVTVGSGYTNPIAVVSAPQNAGTTATASPIVGFAISPTFSISATSPGLNYDAATTQVLISPPDLAGGTQALATATVDSTLGSATFGTITAITLDPLNPGSGYSIAPTVTVYDGLSNPPLSATNTVAPSAVVTAATAAGTGKVFGVNVLTGGTGYTAPATISFTDATGTGAAATAALAGTAGTVTGLTINSGGSGYTTAPSVIFTDKTSGLVHTVAGTAATATVGLATSPGAITGVTLTTPGLALTSAPTITFAGAGGAGTGALATAGLAATGIGAQATVLTATSKSIPVITKAEQELYDDWGRYNTTGGVELPLTVAGIQTTVPLNYIDAPTEILGDDEVQIWKLVDNGFWSNSIHFSGWDVQLINRVGWDGTVKPPASNEVGWKDTVRLNPLEDVMVAMRAKTPSVNFGQPRSTRLQDPTKPINTPSFPAAPALPVAGTQYASGMGFTVDLNVVTQAGTMNAAVVGANKALLATSVNTGKLVGSTTGNYDNEFVWGSAILGHADNDFTRPVVFNPVVITPPTPVGFGDPLGNGKLLWTDPTPVGQLASAVGVTPVLAATRANPQNEIGFKVLRAPLAVNAAGKYLASGAWTNFATVPANVVSFTEPAALISATPPNNQFYAYEVVAYNAAGDSTPSAPWNESPPDAPTLGSGIPLLTPSFIVPASTNADVKLTLQWQDNAINETSYSITRIGGPGAVTAVDATTGKLKVTGGTTTTLTAPANPLPISTNTIFVDPTPLVEGAAYEYDIIAKNSFGVSTPVLWGSLVAPFSPPQAPTNLAYTLVVAAPCPTDAVTKQVVPTQCRPDYVSLTWTDNAFNETRYDVLRNGVVIGTVAATALNNAGSTLTYVDTTAAEGVAYLYTVRAVNALGSVQAATVAGPTGTPVELPVTLPTTLPTLPSNVVVTPSTATVASGTGFIHADSAVVTWSDNAYNESGYQITRTVTAPANLIATPPMVFNAAGSVLNNPMGTATGAGSATPWTSSPVLSFTDNTGLIDGVTYQYAIAGSNVTGTGPAAAATKQMPGVVINPPSNLIVTPNRAGLSIGLQWTDGSTNETDFFVEESVSTQAGAPGTFSTWTPVATVARTAAQTLATGGLVNVNRANVSVTPGFVYTFRVSARNLAQLSDSHPYLYGQASLLGPVFAATGATPTLAVPTIATNGRVTLSWTAVPLTAVTPSTGITMSYRLFANGVQLAQSNRTTFNYRPTSLALQAGITYTVAAVATAVRTANPTAYGSTLGPLSAPSTTIKVTPPPLPAVPTGLAATITAPATGTTVTLNWTAVPVPTGATAGTTITYLLSINGGVGVAVTRGSVLAVPTGATSTVAIATVASYQGVTTTSAYTAPVTVNLSAYPVQSIGLTNTLAALRTFHVSWTNTTAALTGWTIQVSANGGAWTTIAPTVTQAGTTYAFTNVVTAAGSYRFRVQAKSAAGTTAYVTSAAVTTL